MEIFKGIGDFFGGLFGQKKKREDEQQPQQQQSAVSFNSTPKLGDNFANNLSNPTQPQQPKEFAKSSVDLNPVKPVQPVQSQPQMNREQERQQLANKYRQEETDRYNQGSDHAANFLNDIFSGGKTAQMRENTINQNIQNRVNAEMLRKYGPDDQQVKQNIDQTSQNINKNATAVSDFTKNYNNNVQQTISAPVSAVKGTANSVVETVPKVSGAITELGANTIKLFDEDNQFANNLIKRVRADREKNIVRKTLNDATVLTDQDNKLAYGLGSSGVRMAIDTAMTPVTGGVAPALVHGVESHSEMMDNLDNIEARKKAEAAAKGETYTPSSFTSRYLASTANAGAQAAIEKLGIDNLTGKIGGKFAKNMVGRAITGALGEAGEEASQQYTENFTKKLFDNKQDIYEGVTESALMGGIMGGAGKMAFGGMESVKNPYKSNDMADGEVSISKLHPDQMGYNKDAVLGKFTGDTRKRMSDRSFNMLQDLRANNPYVTGDGSEISLTNKGNTKLTRTGQNISDDLFIAKMRTTPRINQIIENSTYSHSADDFKNHNNATGGFDYRNTPIRVSGKRYDLGLDIAKNNSTGINTLYNLNIKEPALGGFLRPPIKASSNTDSIAQNPQNVNDNTLNNAQNINSLYGATTKENISTPGLRDNPSTKSYADVYDSNIAQNTQKVNAFNQEYEPEIQDLQNAYQKYGDDFEFNLTPEQQAVYEHLLRESPRDSEGRYIDPVTGEVTIDQIVDRPDGSRYVEIDNNIINGLQRKTDIQKAVKNHISENFQGNQYQIGDTGEYAKVTKKTKNEIAHQQKIMSDIDYEIKARMSGNLDELINTMQDVRRVENKKTSKKPNVDYYLSGRTEVVVDGEAFYPRVDIEVGKNGNVIAYDIADVKRSKKIEPRSEQYNRSYIRKANSVLDNQGSAYGSNIPQKNQKVNRIQPFEPIEHTPLANGDRDFGGSFGNGFNPRGENSVYKIAQDSKGDLVEIEQNIFEGVPRNKRAKTLRKYLQQNLQGNEYGLNYDRDGNVRITRDSTYKISNPRQNSFVLGKKGEIISELPDILTISQKTGWAPDGKDHSFARDGFEYRQSRVKLGDEVYTVNLNVGLNQNGKVLYEINDIKKESPITGANSSFESSDSFNTNSLAQNGDNVNTSGSEKRYLLNSTPETDQKIRKFAETVLDTAPPKDFVKLMHTGDESLKYTPKKNSELWNKAAKSVQESPERVFNELENTRVANDETMAKGIALAKHYQAMGDDLKASELYVEIAVIGRGETSTVSRWLGC